MQKVSIITAILVLATSVFANVKLPSIISDNMVLQQNRKVNLWGWADAGEKVSITASWGETAKVIANAKGAWETTIVTPKASNKTYTVSFKGNNEIIVNNILVGETWLASGQSNMTMTVRSSDNAKEEIANAKYPEIRMFTVVCDSSPIKREDCKGIWKVCSPSTVAGWSATAYFFGRKVYQDLRVPVGLILSAWSASNIETWISEKYVNSDATLKWQFARQKKLHANFDKEKAQRTLEKQLKSWEAKKKSGKNPRYKPSLRPAVYPQQFITHCYNGMIYPIRNYTIKGAIWYQGEANARKDFNYAKLVGTMLENWREEWAQGNFPFYAVQLPNYRVAWKSRYESQSGWAYIREQFDIMSKNIKNTDYSINLELGDAQNIHPPFKQDVGKRLALLALKKTYGKTGFAWSGPKFKSHHIEGNKVVVKFDTFGAPLAARANKEPFGFAVFDAAGKVYEAKAKIISDDTIEIYADKLNKPVGASYAWADNPEGSNIVSTANLPAGPFRCGKIPQKDAPQFNTKILETKDCIGNLFEQQWKITLAGTRGLAKVKTLNKLLSFSLSNTTDGKNFATIFLPLKDKLWITNTQKISFEYQGRKENKKSFFSLAIARMQKGRWIWKISKGIYVNNPKWKKINFNLDKDFAMPKKISEIIMVKIIINSCLLPKGHEAIVNFKDWKISE